MSDDDGLIRPADAADHRYGETLLYDFAKFLTTLSMIALGGVLTLSGAAAEGRIAPSVLYTALIAIGAAGVLAIVTASDLVSARAQGREPAPRLRRQVGWSMGLLGIGAGSFLGMFLDTIR